MADSSASWWLAAALIVVSAAVASAQTKDQTAPAEPIQRGIETPLDKCDSSGQAQTVYLNGTSMIGLRSCWDADRRNGSFRVLSDLYAQWTLRRIDQGNAPREYQRERKGAIERLFVGRDRSFVGSIRIDMHDPDQTMIIPLVAFGYQGKVGKGQSWVTDVIGDDQSLPFFRIGPSSSATITVTAKSTDDMEVRATSSVLSALRAIGSIVTPGGSLLTSLNRNSLNQASNTVDNALSNIWSETIDEHEVTGRQLSEWYETSGFTIEVVVPSFVRTGANRDDPAKTTVRRYALQLSCPRFSIFDAAVACRRGERAADQPTFPGANSGSASTEFRDTVTRMKTAVTAQQILNFPLAQGKTLAQFLSDQSWYTEFLRMVDEPPPAAVSGGAGPPKPEKARTIRDYTALCRRIVDTLYGAGLNNFDARLGLWAAIAGSADFVGLTDKFQENTGCTTLLPTAGGAGWTFKASG